MRRVESKSPCSSLYGDHSVDVGCMVFLRLYSVERRPSLTKQVFWETTLLEAGRRPAAGAVTEEVWTKWNLDSKWDVCAGN